MLTQLSPIQQESLRDKFGRFVEKAVNAPLVIGYHLGGKPARDIKLLRNLAVGRNVSGIKGGHIA